MNDPELPPPLEPLAEVILGFDHVAFGVPHLTGAVTLFTAMGGSFLKGGDNRRAGFRWLQYQLADGTKFEAIAPVADDCFLHSFLERRGPGIHHLTFRVSDLRHAAQLAEEAGYEVVGLWDEAESWKECFLHPRSAMGTVIQLAQWIDKDDPPPTLEAVLAGEVYSLG